MGTSAVPLLQLVPDENIVGVVVIIVVSRVGGAFCRYHQTRPEDHIKDATHPLPVPSRRSYSLFLGEMTSWFSWGPARGTV